MKDELALIACGGTIDKLYFDVDSNYRIGEPTVRAILKRGGAHFCDSQVISLMKKDSLAMTPDDRNLLATTIIQCPQRRVMVTHGTDTMVKSAEMIDGAVKDKIVVFTGSFLPAAFRDSDADFNIGFAMSAALFIPNPGVYIAMNGCVFPALGTYKNRDKGFFVNNKKG